MRAEIKSESGQSYETEIKVQFSDIDQLGHVNNVVYLKWTQNIATEHWYSRASREQIEKLLWVVTKHEIEYKRPAYYPDIIVARTWVGKATGRYFERFTDFHNKETGKLISKVKSLWVPVDVKTQRRTSVDSEVYEQFSVTKT